MAVTSGLKVLNYFTECFFFFRELNTSHSSEDQHDWAAEKPEGESQPAAESVDIKYVNTGYVIFYGK